MSLLFLLLVACTPDEGGDTATPIAESPEYVVTTTIFGDEGATSYVLFLDTLDAGTLTLDDAREHPGWATASTVGGMAFVGEGETPTVHRYSADDQGNLVDDGSLSFLDYGVASAALYENFFAGPTRSYLTIDTTHKAIWDPTALEIIGEMEVTGVPADRGGRALRASYDRGGALRDGIVYESFYWSDDDYYFFDGTSSIVAIDPATDTVAHVFDAPCPGLDVASSDEDGNLYWSNFVFSIQGPLFEVGEPENCVVKLPAGSFEFDTSWTRNLSDLVEGRQVAVFRYVADGVGIAAVFHAEDVPAESVGDPNSIFLNVWKMWRFDLDAGTAAPIQDIAPFSGGYYAFQIEGRTVLLLPSGDYSATTAVEITSDGTVTPLFDIPGWSYQLADLR